MKLREKHVKKKIGKKRQKSKKKSKLGRLRLASVLLPLLALLVSA